MNSQTAVRSQNRTRRSLTLVKAEYDAAVARAAELDIVYERQRGIFDARKRDLKHADRSSRRALLKGEREEHDRWFNQAELIESEAILKQYNHLKRLYEEYELAQALADNLKREIAEEVRFWRAELAQVSVSEVPLMDVKIVDKGTGEFHVYFGGIKVPDGPGHGHFVFQLDGSLRFPLESQPVPRWR